MWVATGLGTRGCRANLVAVEPWVSSSLEAYREWRRRDAVVAPRPAYLLAWPGSRRELLEVVVLLRYGEVSVMLLCVVWLC